MTYKYHRDGTQPSEDEIFVFGSNLAGIHGAGAARQAYKVYGAKWGIGFGYTGRCFALPTKDCDIESMELVQIEQYIKMFVMTTHSNPNKKFFITRCGCQLAGFKNKEIAPMFKKCNTNCNFPDEWEEFLEN